MRRRKSALRASFIVTFAATVGCAETQVTHNPPPPDRNPPPQQEEGTASIEVEEKACVEHVRRRVDDKWVEVRSPRKVDCPAERVFKREDGQCFMSFPDPCNHPGCNPPPPQPVECPPGK